MFKLSVIKAILWTVPSDKDRKRDRLMVVDCFWIKVWQSVPWTDRSRGRNERRVSCIYIKRVFLESSTFFYFNSLHWDSQQLRFNHLSDWKSYGSSPEVTIGNMIPLRASSVMTCLSNHASPWLIKTWDFMSHSVCLCFQDQWSDPRKW